MDNTATVGFGVALIGSPAGRTFTIRNSGGSDLTGFGVSFDGPDIVLTDWIVAETGNGLARTPERRQFPEAVRQMRLSSGVRILPVAAALMQHALDLYESRFDKRSPNLWKEKLPGSGRFFSPP